MIILVSHDLNLSLLEVAQLTQSFFFLFLQAILFLTKRMKKPESMALATQRQSQRIRLLKNQEKLLTNRKASEATKRLVGHDLSLEALETNFEKFLSGVWSVVRSCKVPRVKSINSA